MENVDSAIERERNLAEAQRENLKSTFERETGSVNITKERPSASAYLPQSKSVAELAKKSASGLRDFQSPDEEGTRRSPAGQWKPKSSSFQNGLQPSNKKIAIDGKSINLAKSTGRANFFTSKTTPAGIDELKAQLDELTNKLLAITPDETISGFEDSLNKIKEKIQMEWSFGGEIYAPSYVTALFEETKKIIDHSGSRSAFAEMQNKIQDIEVSLHKALELRSIQNSLIASVEPKLNACKHDLDKFARTLATQEKIKASLYDLMSLVKIEQCVGSESDNNKNNKTRKPTHLLDQWREYGIQKASQQFSDDKKQYSIEKIFENDINKINGATDSEPKNEKNNRGC